MNNISAIKVDSKSDISPEKVVMAGAHEEQKKEFFIL